MNGSDEVSLDDLALFTLVVEAGGFAAAGRAHGRPQATTSRRIAALERALGMQLLDRSARRIALTEVGRRVYDHARLMRDQADAARMAAAEMAETVGGSLTITAPVILGQALVVPIIAGFLRDHPKIDVQVEWTTRAVDPAQDDVDIAIRLGDAANGDLVRLRLGQARARLFAPPTFSSHLPVRVPRTSPRCRRSASAVA